MLKTVPRPVPCSLLEYVLVPLVVAGKSAPGQLPLIPQQAGHHHFPDAGEVVATIAKFLATSVKDFISNFIWFPDSCVSTCHPLPVL